MSQPVRIDQGGIRNLERLRARCFVDERTGCWRWPQAKTHYGVAVVFFIHPETGCKCKAAGRTAGWILANGFGVPKGRIVRRDEECESKDCCNPEHGKLTTRAELARFRARSGQCAPTAADRLKNLKAQRDRSRKIQSIEVAREIRASTRLASEEARLRGCSDTTIRKIRRGELWRETNVVASVFDLGLAT